MYDIIAAVFSIFILLSGMSGDLLPKSSDITASSFLKRKKFSFFIPFFISDASFHIYVYNYTIIEIKVNVS